MESLTVVPTHATDVPSLANGVPRPKPCGVNASLTHPVGWLHPSPPLPALSPGMALLRSPLSPGACRFLSYGRPFTQPVPARLDGTSHHPHVLDSGFSVPHGLLDPHGPTPEPRTRWTEAALTLPPHTWWTTGELKYTAAELILRGRTAAGIAKQAGKGRSHAATERDLKRLGVRGASIFSSLSYFKCAPCHCIALPCGPSPCHCPPFILPMV